MNQVTDTTRYVQRQGEDVTLGENPIELLLRSSCFGRRFEGDNGCAGGAAATVVL